MSIDNSKMKKVLEQLNSWCTKHYPQVQSVYDDCAGYTLQQLVYYLLGVVKNCVDQVVENSDAFNDLETEFIELKEFVDNYFENLDVQEEINNKLEEMINSGELESILANFFKWFVTPEMFGAKGDGSTDDTLSVIKALNTNIPCCFNNKYLITDNIILNNDAVIFGNGKIIYKNSKENNDYYGVFELSDKSNITILGVVIEMSGGISTPVQFKCGIHGKNSNNIIIRDVTINGVDGVWGVMFEHSTNILIKSITIETFSYGGVGLLDACHKSKIFDCNINNCVGSVNNLQYGIVLNTVLNTPDEIGSDIICENNTITNMKIWEAIDAHAGERIIIRNNKMLDCANGISVFSTLEEHENILPLNNVIIDSNYFYGLGESYRGEQGIAAGINARGNNIVISNNIIRNCGQSHDLMNQNTSSPLVISGGENIDVHDNLFDIIWNCAIYVRGQINNLNIHDNNVNGITVYNDQAFFVYFENCDIGRAIVHDNIVNNQAGYSVYRMPSLTGNTYVKRVRCYNNEFFNDYLVTFGAEFNIGDDPIDMMDRPPSRTGTINDFVFNVDKSSNLLGWLCTKSSTWKQGEGVELYATWKEIYNGANS